MEFQETWSEAMMIGPLCQFWTALFDCVGELNWTGKGGAVGSMLQALLVMGEGGFDMVSSKSQLCHC